MGIQSKLTMTYGHPLNSREFQFYQYVMLLTFPKGNLCTF